MEKHLQLKEEEKMKLNKFRHLLGIETVEINEGAATLSMPYNENLLQGLGMIHGGALSSLMDSVIGSTIRTVLHGDESAVTVEMNINYVRPAKAGKITAKGKVVSRGKKIAVGIGDIFSEDGKLLATGRATFAIIGKTSKK